MINWWRFKHWINTVPSVWSWRPAVITVKDEVWSVVVGFSVGQSYTSVRYRLGLETHWNKELLSGADLGRLEMIWANNGKIICTVIFKVKFKLSIFLHCFDGERDFRLMRENIFFVLLIKVHQAVIYKYKDKFRQKPSNNVFCIESISLLLFISNQRNFSNIYNVLIRCTCWYDIDDVYSGYWLCSRKWKGSPIFFPSFVHQCFVQEQDQRFVCQI